MNFLGHPYIAYKILGKLDPDIVVGSHIPDVVPFVPDSVFTFEEIHESPDVFHNYLQKNTPQKINIALAMMTHSIKYGADKFNREIETWLLGDNNNLANDIAERIADCSGISLNVAKKHRMHNYLWMGFDIYLLKTQKKFVNNLAYEHTKIDTEILAGLLAGCFKKDTDRIKRDLNYIFNRIDPKNLESVEGIVKLWKITLSGLPENDKVNEKKSAVLFNFIHNKFIHEWDRIFNEVAADVKKRMGSFL